MAEGEHTIISKIPRERLNQIAARKLASLSLPVRLAADRETLEGELAFATRVENPLNGAPVPRTRFVVVGHDHLRFLDPPLAGLAPVLFFDAERTGALESRVVEQLRRHVAVLNDLAARLRALRIAPTLDADRLALRAVVKTAGHAFEILGGSDGLRISRVAPVGGKPFEVASTFPALRLEEHASLTDLEIWLEDRVAAMKGAPPPAAAHATAAPLGRLEGAAPPRNALVLSKIVEAFGGEAVLAPNAPVEVFREFQHAGTHYRFVATREVGTTFKGRLIGPTGDVWSDKFDLANFPGISQVVASALGLHASAVAPASDAPASSGGAADAGSVPQHLMPHPGEVWVMSVVIEQMGEEVRYVGTDIDGRPYGAARVLKRPDFEAVFSNERGGWRLLILIDQVQDGQVAYRQLDRQRHPLGAVRKMAASVLVANFVPEAAAY
jgi:hypothetical protein